MINSIFLGTRLEALEALKEMNNAYERDMQEMSADDAKV